MTDRTITVAGKTYTLNLIGPTELDKFVTWANTKLPDPVKAILPYLKDLSPALQEVVMRDALKQKRLRECRSVDSEEVQALMHSGEGAMKILALAFSKAHPELTEKDIETIFNTAEQEHGADYLLARLKGLFPKQES